MDLRGARIGIIGGSLGGLSAALVLGRLGAEVTVFERGARGFEARGGGLGLDVELASTVAGREDAPPHLVLRWQRMWHQGLEEDVPSELTVTSYGALWSWLRAGLPEAAVRLGEPVELEQADSDPDRVYLKPATGPRLAFDLVVSADGGTSETRRWIAGPEARREFATYVLWRGLVPVAALDPAHGFAERFNVANAGSRHLVAYAIPSHVGETSPGARLLNWGWYYPLLESDLPKVMTRAGESAPHALGRDTAPAEWTRRLESDARELWPAWGRHLVERTLAGGVLAPHPIYEYSPTRMARGRVALAGDAAHLASPITGSGARMAMEDALVLGEALVRGASVPEALELYARSRLELTRSTVQFGRRHGAVFRASPARPG